MLERKRVFYIRRGIFLLTALAVIIPLLTRVQLPMAASWPAQDLYDAVEAVPADKIVVFSASWSAGSQGETAPQTKAILRHLMKSGKRFAIWSWSDVQGPELTQAIAEPLARKYHRQYGVDWVNWGFKTGGSAMLRGWAENIWKTVKEDRKRTPLAKLPIMKNVHSHRDIGLIIDVSSGAVSGVPTVLYYVQFLKGIHNVPVGYACTGVMAAEAFPYLDSKQLVGLLRGLAGAAEYEQLLGFPDEAAQRMTAQSFAHILVILLIVAGNVGYFWSRRKASQ